MKKIILSLIFVILGLSLISCKEESPQDVTKLIYGPDYPYTEYIENINTEVRAYTPEEAITYIGTDLLKCVYNGEDNVLISPTSIFYALSMTGTGAKGDTFEQFEKLLGRGLSFDEITQFSENYGSSLKNSEYVKTGLANSLWIRDDKAFFEVKDSFSEKVRTIFDAEVFTEKFDSSTVDKINNWVKDKTDSMIDGIVDEIDKETVMYLINAMYFDGEWENVYYENSVRDGFVFTNVLGEEEFVTGMFSSEKTYLSDENTTGFIKNYKGGEYGFAVLLPDEGISINDYIKELNGEKIVALLNSRENVKVSAKMPKFKFEYISNLNESLKALGLVNVFDPLLSDLTGIEESKDGNLYVSNVLHKTYIEVAEKGTKAAAVTSVEIDKATAAIPQKTEYVTVDRPYIFMIIDNTSSLPIFMGVVLSVE